MRICLRYGIYYGLFLLDIEMWQVSGMDLAEKIRGASPDAKTIFITSYLEYAITDYEFFVFRYISKTQIEEWIASVLAIIASGIILLNTAEISVSLPTLLYTVVSNKG